jgi:adenylate cyclase
MNASEGTGAPADPTSQTGALNGRIDLAREPQLRLGPLGVEPARRRVIHDDGREEILEPRVMQVLVALIRADGQIVTRDDLLMSCWHGVVVGEDAINRVMGRVRRLAERLGDGRIELETVIKVGYRLVLPQHQATHAAARLAASDRTPSICVLPFANMSGDPEQAYFSDGITEDIVTDLSKVSTLFVVARTTVEKGSDALSIARELRVGHVLEGSVRKVDDRVRITAQLIDGATGGHVWAERYDRELKGIFALQDEISQDIVAALKLKLLPEEKTAIERRGTTVPEAYNLYLQARRYYENAHDSDLRSLQVMERLCRHAVEIDPDYARAWELLGFAQTMLNTNYFAPGDGGVAAVERALAIDPDLVQAHVLKARHLVWRDRHDEAFAEVELALRLEPRSSVANAQAGRMHYMRRRYAEAIGYLETATAAGRLSPSDSGIWMTCYHKLGDDDGLKRAAIAMRDRGEAALAQGNVNGAAMGCLAGALVALGEPDRARDLVKRALLIDPDNMTMRYNFSCDANVFLQDADTAIELLAPVLARTTRSFLEHAKTDPDMEFIRQDPRYQAMVAVAEARLGAQSQPSG